jgi:hypothetical protein
MARRNSGFNHPGHSPTEIIIPKKRSTEADPELTQQRAAASVQRKQKTTTKSNSNERHKISVPVSIITTTRQEN